MKKFNKRMTSATKPYNNRTRNGKNNYSKTGSFLSFNVNWHVNRATKSKMSGRCSAFSKLAISIPTCIIKALGLKSSTALLKRQLWCLDRTLTESRKWCSRAQSNRSPQDYAIFYDENKRSSALTSSNNYKQNGNKRRPEYRAALPTKVM